MNRPYALDPEPQADFFMKRFFFLSSLFHGAVLLLLFSWEIPLADHLLPKSILKVSLVEKIEKNIEENKSQGNKPAPSNNAPKVKIAEEKNVEATRGVAPTNREEKREAPKQEKIEATPIETKEGKPQTDEKPPLEDRILKAKGEEPLRVQGKTTAQTAEAAASKELSLPPKGPRIFSEKGDSGAFFMASAGPEMDKEGGQAGRGGKGSSPAKGEGGSLRLSNIRSSPQEIDPILSEIIRKIEGAKRYPRAARRMGIEGQATVRFKLKPTGKVDSVEVVESSGSDLLDQASLETIERAAPLPYKEGWLKIVIVFKIL